MLRPTLCVLALKKHHTHKHRKIHKASAKIHKASTKAKASAKAKTSAKVR